MRRYDHKNFTNGDGDGDDEGKDKRRRAGGRVLLELGRSQRSDGRLPVHADVFYARHPFEPVSRRRLYV